MKNHSGVTLIELMFAIVILSCVVITISTTFPKASAAIVHNRQRWLARNLAASALQELKDKPYSYVDPTDPLNFGTVPDCDCGAVNMSVFPSTGAVLIDSGVTYQARSCINLVNPDGAGAWNSVCPDRANMAGTDKGLKNIRVRVVWASGNQTYYTDLQTMVTP